MSFLNMIGPTVSFAFGESTYGKAEIYGPMAGCQIEAIYLRTGRVEVRHDDHVFALNAPGVALAASCRRLEYRYGPAGMNNVLWCQCTSAALTPRQVAPLMPHCGPLPPSAAATALMKVGADLPSDIYSERRDFTAALGIAVMEELLARRKMQASAAEIPPQVLQARRYIEEHFATAITMDTLARVCNLSPQHLNRLYRAAFAENPLDYLWRLRVRRGAYLLRHTGMRISQIAYQTGFKTPNHFARLIRERYALSPRQLRSRKWQGAPGT